MLKKAQGAGADFAALAKKYSEDESNNAKRRRPRLLRPRPHGAGVRDTAAFAMKHGEISDLVKTAFGYHIIKMVDNKPETTRPLAEVRTRDRGSAEVAEGAGRSREDRQVARGDASRRRPISIASPRSAALQVTETGLIARDEPIQRRRLAAGAVGPRCSRMKEGEVTPAMRVADRLGVRHASPAGRTPTSRSSMK